MKITTPKGYVIELSADEAEALFPGLIRGVRRQLTELGEHQPATDEPLSEARLVRRVLRRHRIPPTQRAVYRALYEAGDDGLDFTALAATTGRSTEELSGVLGGLGRRVNGFVGRAQRFPRGREVEQPLLNLDANERIEIGRSLPKDGGLGQGSSTIGT